MDMYDRVVADAVAADALEAAGAWAWPSGAKQPSPGSGGATLTHAHALLSERTNAIDESIGESRVKEAGRAALAAAARSESGCLAAEGAAEAVHGGSSPKRQSLDPSGAPWSPLTAGGTALLQLSTAPGAHVRVRGQQLELSAQPERMFEHITELLQEHLARHPWYAEPLRIAADRQLVHLRSARLRVTSALDVAAINDDGECVLTFEGVAEPEHVRAEVRAADDDDEPADGEFEVAMAQLHRDVPVPSGEFCATFTNEINLLDLVADVQDIYESFTAHISTSQTATPMPRPAPAS